MNPSTGVQINFEHHTIEHITTRFGRTGHLDDGDERGLRDAERQRGGEGDGDHAIELDPLPVRRWSSGSEGGRDEEERSTRVPAQSVGESSRMERSAEAQGTHSGSSSVDAQAEEKLNG